MVAVIFMLALFMLALSIAAPKAAREIQRDRDLETIQRGKQYIRAIKLFYKKLGAYPPNPDALYKPVNGVRFLRKKYVDPTTGKDEWRPIRFGLNKTLPMGYFGQAIGTLPPAAQGLCGNGNGTGGTGTAGTPGTGNPTGTGGTAGTAGTGGFGSLGIGCADDSAAGTAPVDPNNPLAGNQNQNASANSSSNNSSSSGSSSSSGEADLSGLVFGGAGIIGFAPTSPKKSVIVWRKKDHYKDWEFTYDPLVDQMIMTPGNAGTIGQPAGSNATPVGSSAFGGSSSGSSVSSGSFGSGSSSGGSGGSGGSTSGTTP